MRDFIINTITQYVVFMILRFYPDFINILLTIKTFDYLPNPIEKKL